MVTFFGFHLFKIRKQQAGKNLDQYLNYLKILAEDCTFSATQHKEETIRDSLVNDIKSSYILQGLFELKFVDLNTTFKNPRALEIAHKHADFYAETFHVAAAQAAKEIEPAISVCSPSKPEEPITASIKQICFF